MTEPLVDRAADGMIFRDYSQKTSIENHRINCSGVRSCWSKLHCIGGACCGCLKT